MINKLWVFILTILLSSVFIANLKGELNIVIPSDSIIKVEGKVLNASTKEPIKASITYELMPYGSNIGFSTSKIESGTYQLYVIPGRQYRFKVKASGFIPIYEEIEITSSTKESVFAKDFLLVSSKQASTIRLEKLLFEQGKAKISSYSYNELNTIVSMLQLNPTMIIQLEGHTDFRGNAKLNMALSKDRVKAVKTYLVKHGVRKKRIKVKAYGGTQPLTQSLSEEARRLNRRVEVRIIQK